MKAFGAELILVTPRSRRHGVRPRFRRPNMEREGKGRVLDQFANADNPRIHYETTGPEIWQDTGGKVTHFVSAMGTTGTITGVSRYLKERNPAVRIIGAQPSEGSSHTRASASGLRPTCPESTNPSAWTSWSTSARPTPRTCCRQILARTRRVSSAGISAAGAAGWPCKIAKTVRENDHRVRRLRPRRPLPVYRGVSRLKREAAMAEYRFCPQLRRAFGLAARQMEDSGEHDGTPALPRLRLHPLEQPHARAGRGDRAMCRP
jgi:hypothetical protein